MAALSAAHGTRDRVTPRASRFRIAGPNEADRHGTFPVGQRNANEEGEWLEITSEIWQVGGAGFTSPEDAAVYLIRCAGRAAVVDAGCGGHSDRLAANIRSCGVTPGQVEYLLLTHCHFDHTGGAQALAAEFGCPVVIHEQDAAALINGDSQRTAAHWYGRSMQPLQPDVMISDRTHPLPLGDRVVTAIHLPGHTPGSVVFQVPSDGLQVLFGQDVHGPLHADFGSDALAYRRSLTQMADLKADILCEGHYGIIEGAEQVRTFIRSFL